MRKEAVIISLVLIVLMSLAVVSAACNQVETISPDSSIWQGNSVIYGDNVVWTKDETNIEGDYWSNNIWVYNIQTESSNKITSNLGTQEIFETSHNPRIYGDKIIWVTKNNKKVGGDYFPVEPSLFLYNLSSEKKTLIVDSDNGNPPKGPFAIYGDRVAWIAKEDSSGDNVYLYDISTNITTKITNEADYRPANIDIYEDKIVWAAWYQPFNPSEGDTVNVYMYNLGSLRPIIENVSQDTRLQIYGNKVAYTKYNYTRGNTYGNSNYDLYINNIDTGESTPINFGIYSNWYIDPFTNFRMDADKIIFPLMDGQGKEKGVFVYDINDKTTIKLDDANDGKNQVFFDTQNGKFVWVEWKSDINSIKLYNTLCCVPECSSDETCENGVCVKQDVSLTCTNECEILEEKGCFNDTNYHICGNFDDDGCLEWSKSILCTMGPIGRICVDNGECVGFPDLPTKECESIGLRENGKYCSPEYELEIQKINQEICENNFECKTNVCKENTCSAVKVIVEDKTWIIWLIIGGIILVIIISYFIWKKTKKQQPIQTQPQVQTK